MKVKVKINVWNIYCVITAFSIFRLDGLLYIAPLFKYIYAFLQLCIFGFTVLLFAKYIKMNSAIVLMLIYFLFNFVNTIIHQGNLEQIFTMILSDFLFSVVVFISCTYDFDKFISCLQKVAVIFIILNLLNMILLPSGLGLTRSSNKIFILSSDNALVKYIIFFCVINEIYYYIFPQKKG